MLTLIGLGLNDEKDLTLRGIETARNADKVFIELYTGLWHGSIENLEEIIGKKIVEMDRKDLEDSSDKFLNQAKTSDIVLFIQGDPLIATSHESLITEAKKMKIKTKVIHNSSIFSAISETGLHIQKFGPTVTIPFSEKTNEKLPKSVYDVISENKKRNLHTLCLLDVMAETKKYMSANEALAILFQMENKLKGKVIDDNSDAIVFENAGSDQGRITFGKVKDLMKKQFEIFPQVLILTAKLHFTEKEYLNA